ncbi:histidine phosphatase family protein [Magnetovibrio blakemorei]|uniref:histidine phosphatase family protein n=1 Tax=Magnetovibrio blakemorei TaxID=28181 RepID=UPI0009FF38D4|nr:histidine phosphatase family protein [Magnetovibrio blakemorei]
MTELILIRHGPTTWNELGLLQGRTDVPLSNYGRTLIRDLKLPRELINAKWVSSPLSRATETANILGQNPTIENALIETDWGEWEGYELSKIRDQNNGKIPGIDTWDIYASPPSGESLHITQSRVKSWLEETSSENSTTVAVTHKGVIRSIFLLAFGNYIPTLSNINLSPTFCHKFSINSQGTIEIMQVNINLRHS